MVVRQVLRGGAPEGVFEEQGSLELHPPREYCERATLTRPLPCCGSPPSLVVETDDLCLAEQGRMCRAPLPRLNEVPIWALLNWR